MKPELDNHDWREAFGYAGEEGTSGSPDVRPAFPPHIAEYNLTPFTREDVKEICGIKEGANDEEAWRIYGRLKDGRWFYLEASCDYTGWDCQAGGSATIAKSRQEIETMGMGNEAREVFGLPKLSFSDAITYEELNEHTTN